ncbi:MAG: HAMP domain-containing histidine kinase [Anaeromyxobacter sp.]|nr:HAMP domain-containing histidine kinase [Anaeromyxobacter sp.]
MSGGDHRGGRSGPRHGRLFWRVYGHGLLLLVLVTLAVGAAAWAVRSAWPTREPHRLTAYAVARVAELRDRPEALRVELEHVREAFDVAVTVYDAEGGLVASNVAPPLPPVPELERPRGRERPRHLRGHGFTFAAPLPDGGHLVLSGGPPEGVLYRIAGGVAVVLLVLALGSWPFARTIARPIEQLTLAARRLGSGDLATRAGLSARGEVGELGAAFDDMAARLERLVRSEKELLANVSHELRTPLARIRVALALAEEGDMGRARQALGEIGEDLGELERLVDEVLAATRLDLGAAGELPLHQAPLEVAALVEDAAARFRARHPERKLAVEVAGDLPALEADAALLRRLLGNLLDNAAKYSDAPAPVALAARAAPGGLTLEVRDQGIGIDPADLPRLFTPFFRTDRSRARGTGGVGLGLALARRIAEAHGGSITVESAPGAGTTVR